MAKRKHTIFGHVTQGMNVVNAIAKDDVIKRSLLREKALWQKSLMLKVFSDYFLNKVEDAKNKH
jgi:cyclophilin family peptidyl-prolyl cis-trans isomerase